MTAPSPQYSSGTEQCPYDGGFDAEIGPIGCCLDLDGMHGCVCRRFTSPQIAGVRDGWKLVPERPTHRQMDAGLYQSSADSTYGDVWSIYADMIDTAPSLDDHSDQTTQVNKDATTRAISPQAQAGETRETAEAWVWKDGIPAPAQWQSDRGEDDPYITDLKFAIEQNIKAARKYKARLDFMEVKYGAIDWDGTASPPAALPAGQVVVTPEMVSAGMAEIPEDGAEYEHVEAAYRKMAALAIPSTPRATPINQELADNTRKITIEECCEIVQACDSGRGNEKFILESIRALAVTSTDGKSL